MQINLLDLAKEKDDNKQFEVLLVPGGMIVYRASYLHEENIIQTATYVPLHGVQDYELKKFLYGER